MSRKRTSGTLRGLEPPGRTSPRPRAGSLLPCLLPALLRLWDVVMDEGLPSVDGGAGVSAVREVAAQRRGEPTLQEAGA